MIIKPYLPSELNRAAAAVSTVLGEVYSGWEKLEGETVFKLIIPAGGVAQVHIPLIGGSVTESGQVIYDGALREGDGITPLGLHEGRIVLECGSGEYCFVVV